LDLTSSAVNDESKKKNYCIAGRVAASLDILRDFILILGQTGFHKFLQKIKPHPKVLSPIH
jgi:hypothetical protein